MKYCWWDVIFYILILVCSLYPSPPRPPCPAWVTVARGGWDIYSEGLNRREVDQIAILGENWHFRWDWFFTGGTWKLLRVWKKKDDSDCTFYNFSPLVPCPNNFLVFCVCILVFHGIYSLAPSTNVFVVGTKKFFLSFSYGLGKFQTSWEAFLLGGLNFLFWRRREREVG